MDIVLKFLPILLIYFTGVILRHYSLVTKENGAFLLRLNFYVSLPALTILTLANAELSWNLMYLPIIGILSIIINYFLALLIGKKLLISQEKLGVFIIGSMIIHTGMSLPFLHAMYGEAGSLRKIIFDLGSDTMIYTFIYFLASTYGKRETNTYLAIKKIIISPVLASFVVGLLLNIFSIRLPQIVNDFLTPLSYLVVPSTLLALGIYFTRKHFQLSRITFIPLMIRTLGGLGMGLLLVSLWDLQGIDKTSALILAAGPIGYNTLTLASLEKLDSEYAATLVSLSVFSGFFYIPLLLLFSS